MQEALKKQEQAERQEYERLQKKFESAEAA
jgi:hypothetical protein